ncbi:MAG TPA: DinB family protein [Candidatus Cybelea sp.]|nr:DinB family protein [Candidatus Cybelea sp.]
MSSPPAGKPGLSGSSSRETFLRVWEREFRTTLRVLRAFPEGALGGKPHERSRTARDLAWQCVIDEGLIGTIPERTVHELRNAPPRPGPPDTIEAIAKAYEFAHLEAFGKVVSLSEEEFGRAVSSILKGGDPRSEHAYEWNMPQPDALWANLMDQVHHRGQLTIYLRLAGGKVPSLYGPSGDQPSPAY